MSLIIDQTNRMMDRLIDEMDREFEKAETPDELEEAGNRYERTLRNLEYEVSRARRIVKETQKKREARIKLLKGEK